MSGPATPLPWPEDYVFEAVRHIARNCDFIESETDPDFSWDRYGDAAYIVHAANAYPQMVALLRAVAGSIRLTDDDYIKWACGQLLADLGELPTPPSPAGTP